MMDSSRNIIKKLRENRILAERKDYKKYSRDELIKMAQDGDQLAIETLVNTHQDFINMMSNKYFLDSGDKDDVKQLVTIAFWNAIKGWNGKGDFEAYAGMIIKRKMTDELRKDDAGKSKINTDSDSLDRTVADDGEGGEMSLGASIPSKSLSPEEEYLGRDGAKKIMKFMKEELSETERKIILRYIEGYKVSEISEEENMKYKSVENAIMRVKNKLADYMRNVRESRQLRLSEGNIFSDEERQILKSVINKIDNVDMNESKESDSLEDSLMNLESELEDLIKTMKETESLEEYEKCLDRIDDIEVTLLKYEDLIPEDDDELYSKFEDVQSLAFRAESTQPESVKKEDPYASRGLSRSDFM